MREGAVAWATASFLSAVNGQLPMTGLFSPWQYDKNRLHSQKSALQGRKQGASALADSEVAYAAAGDRAEHGGGGIGGSRYFAGMMDNSSTIKSVHSQKSALQGRGTVRSTVVGASAIADILQERWTTAGCPAGARSSYPQVSLQDSRTVKPYPRQGIRSFQDLMPPPPLRRRNGPPPLQGGLGRWPCFIIANTIL